MRWVICSLLNIFVRFTHMSIIFNNWDRKWKFFVANNWFRHFFSTICFFVHDRFHLIHNINDDHKLHDIEIYSDHTKNVLVVNNFVEFYRHQALFVSIILFDCSSTNDYQFNWKMIVYLNRVTNFNIHQFQDFKQSSIDEKVIHKQHKIKFWKKIFT
jgi:hypothetical protein